MCMVREIHKWAIRRPWSDDRQKNENHKKQRNFSMLLNDTWCPKASLSYYFYIQVTLGDMPILVSFH